MTDEPKPLPVPCDNCGQAIEHDKKLCVWCLSKRAAQLELEAKQKGIPTQHRLASFVDVFDADIAPFVTALASQRIRRRNRQASVPRNHE